MFLKKLKGAFASIASVAVRAENKDLMEAMVAAGVLVAYADGDLSAEENDTIKKMIKVSPQLSAFGDEPVKVFDKYADIMEASARQGKFDLLKEVSDVTAEEDKTRVLIMAIEVADANDDIDADEMKMLEAIASKLGLRVSDFI